MEKKIKIAAVGDNCIDLYVNTGETTKPLDINKPSLKLNDNSLF
jgi:hypothetical protein